MSLKESSVSAGIRLRAHKFATRLFRNNVGLFQTKDGRKIQTGLAKGSSDLIGFKTVKITPEMAGKNIAVFVAVEVKKEDFRWTPSAIEKTKDQIKFIEFVKNAGGIAGICRTEEEFEDLVK